MVLLSRFSLTTIGGDIERIRSSLGVCSADERLLLATAFAHAAIACKGSRR